MKLASILKQTELFKELTLDHREVIAEKGEVIWQEKGDILFYENEPGDAFYCLINGHIQLYKSNPEGKELIVRLINPGEIFGEVILFELNDYPVTAKALEECQICRIQKEGFLELLSEVTMRNEFISVLMKKQRYLANRIYYLASLDVEERFFSFFEEKFGREEHNVITMSKKDIASAIGTIPETFSRLVNRLKRDEKIKWIGPCLQILWDKTGY